MAPKTVVTSLPPRPNRANLPIGVFDSGVGGLSVLRHIRALLPQEHLMYFADTALAPYGNKPEQVVTKRALAIADFLVQRGAKAIVVACNTATVAAIKVLRAHYPDLVIVGVEPGLKPAAALTRNGKIGVLATNGTLAGEKFQLLRAQISAASEVEFLLQGCTGLASQIELGELDSAATYAMLERYIAPLLAQGADTLVLGCTHYPFVQEAIERIVRRMGTGPVVLVDTGDAVARQLARRLEAAALVRQDMGMPCLEGYTSGAASALEAAFLGLLGLHLRVDEVSISENLENSAPPVHLDLPVPE